jgi:excisionase family DNA binding protein
MSNYTARQVAQRLGVSLKTVLAWIHAGELKAVNVGRTPHGRKPRWRISQAALDAFEALRTSGPPAPRSKRTKQKDGEFSFY